ncbi:MAG: hypothetical protein L0Y36_06850 [Planctomycetales bacterium]|nr:hypothetical protein [Planctomycetales bacterium]
MEDEKTCLHHDVLDFGIDFYACPKTRQFTPFFSSHDKSNVCEKFCVDIADVRMIKKNRVDFFGGKKSGYQY